MVPKFQDILKSLTNDEPKSIDLIGAVTSAEAKCEYGPNDL